MASDPIVVVRSHVGRKIAEIRQAGPQLSPLDLHAKMDAIRELACAHGLAALEGLARCSAQCALLPGHRVTMHSCLDHIGDALDSRHETDCTTILAAVAARLS